jgi:hypothetical protein
MIPEQVSSEDASKSVTCGACGTPEVLRNGSAFGQELLGGMLRRAHRWLDWLAVGRMDVSSNQSRFVPTDLNYEQRTAPPVKQHIATAVVKMEHSNAIVKGEEQEFICRKARIQYGQLLRSISQLIV